MDGYREFISGKAQFSGMSGFSTDVPGFLFDFQRCLVDWACRKGRAAIFADCGMGKTPMQLVWADKVHGRGRAAWPGHDLTSQVVSCRVMSMKHNRLHADDFITIPAWSVEGCVIDTRPAMYGSEEAQEVLVQAIPDDSRPRWYHLEPSQYEVVA